MFKSRGSVTLSLIPNSALVLGLCRPRRRWRRRRLSTIRLGNRRRGFNLGPRPVMHWSCMAGPIRVLKKFMAEIGANRKWIDAYLRSLPILRPQTFPLCWFVIFFLFGCGLVDTTWYCKTYFQFWPKLMKIIAFFIIWWFIYIFFVSTKFLCVALKLLHKREKCSNLIETKTDLCRCSHNLMRISYV